MRPGHACLGKLADALTYIRNSANGFNEVEARVPRKTGDFGALRANLDRLQ